MNILGIHGNTHDMIAASTITVHDHEHRPFSIHDAGASLFISGNHVCTISEERLSRKKYDGSFPEKSIEYCLEAANLTNEDIDVVAIPTIYVSYCYSQNKKTESFLREIFPNSEIMWLSHHQCHAASAVFTSDMNEGSFVTIDGAGSLWPRTKNYNEDVETYSGIETHTIGYFNKEKKIFTLYNGISETCNFGNFFFETAVSLYCKKTGLDRDSLSPDQKDSTVGKIMGLCAYGSNAQKLNLSDNLLYSTSKDLNYTGQPYVVFNNMYPPDVQNMFPGDKILDDVNLALNNSLTTEEEAFIVQYNFECAMLEYLEALRNKNYIGRNICFAGGVFLNILCNSKIAASDLFDNIHIPPYPTDTGLALGAALFACFEKDQEIKMPTNLALLGKNYNIEKKENYIRSLIYEDLRIANHYIEVQYTVYYDHDQLCEFVAKQLANNKIVAWFQDESEHGPRALGSRSILMSPSHKQNKDNINFRIKNREYWRPFAGVILEEHMNDYFSEDLISPYMLYSCNVKSDIDDIDAIKHEDNTCRIQTIDDNLNPKLAALLRAYKRETNTPVLLNTSFNDNGEPIVESPKDAITAFVDMSIDFLILGNWIIKRVV